jgi:signal transduction histidine kinase
VRRWRAEVPGHPGEQEARVDLLVRAERVRALRARLGISQATVVVNSAVAAVVFWDRGEPRRLIAWLLAVWAVAVVRLAVGSAFRPGEADPGRVARWERSFTLGAGVNGLAWGAAPLVLLGGGLPVEYAIFVAFLLGGMAAGAALSNASHPPAFFAFTVPALAPACAILMAGGDRIHVAMGVLLAIFGVAVSALSISGGRALAVAVRLQHRNAGLAERLAGTAAELETRVQERTAQLETALVREREAEHRFAHAARLASVGTLAAGVAHEINNPLAYLRSSLQFVGEELASGPLPPDRRGAVLEALGDAAGGADRVGAIVRQLTDLSRVELRAGQGPVALHTALDACIDMAGQEVRGRARVVRSYGDVPAVIGDRAGLIQVFLNLILNAAEAIPDGDPDGNAVRISTSFDARAGEVVVEVADTGAGIPPDLMERIWTPFFTTKPAGRGAGLGLSICKAIAGSLGGRIAVRSQEGLGSAFTVSLKAAPPA